jgi:hypothetical protein
MNIRDVSKYLLNHQNEPKIFEQDYFYLAICETIIGEFTKAQNLYEQALLIMLEPKSFWRDSSQPNWLIDIAILSGRKDIYPLIHKELINYRMNSSKNNPIGKSPMACYCYCVMEFLYPTKANTSDWINEIIKYPKYKDLYAAGLSLRAILDQDQKQFSNSIQLLLKAHNGIAKFGGLRLSPEGWLCLSAMSLCFLADKVQLDIDIENDLLSLSYLNYIKRDI